VYRIFLKEEAVTFPETFKPTTENESLHEISNNNGVRVINFAMSKN
jgi:hypothetical protein